MIRIAVTGQTGQVALSLLERAAKHDNITVVAIGRPVLDFERPESVGPAIRAARPDIVVNAAAYTAVDKAESEPARAMAINRDSAEAAALAARALGVPLIQLSTDYVYPGDKAEPYVETDATGPLGVYGATKLAGEIAVRAAHPAALILRTSWVYSPFGVNFVKTMLRIGRERSVVKVVDDQQGNPTSAIDIADALLRIAPALTGTSSDSGIFHLCATGSVSWCGFARHIFATSARLGGPAPQVEAIRTAEFPTAARRPGNSRMRMEAFAERFGFVLPAWQNTVDDTIMRLLETTL